MFSFHLNWARALRLLRALGPFKLKDVRIVFPLHGLFVAQKLLPTLTNRRLQEIAIIMYKVQINISPTYRANLFITNTRRYALRKVKQIRYEVVRDILRRLFTE